MAWAVEQAKRKLNKHSSEPGENALPHTNSAKLDHFAGNDVTILRLRWPPVKGMTYRSNREQQQHQHPLSLTLFPYSTPPPLKYHTYTHGQLLLTNKTRRQAVLFPLEPSPCGSKRLAAKFLSICLPCFPQGTARAPHCNCATFPLSFRLFYFRPLPCSKADQRICGSSW